MTHSL